ncbi:type I site-specific restriction-modification system, R subunit [Companilactobacillus nodensis DSM 19682 = JCM 14932 = NBRC 107160]|uniref:Type I restriction enzyme endonuclease subunit n=1 Tax=Companilactobacillus nodensis DSM 19682 = JCM 14932 = NBRC 107160 TaxID=1423775 RepID=A0A0R1KB49_9LACO|nr:HsdR family type I site-specific deoxyribonuclease [Companilactobacillus nodensis]KRK80895.1 type I site-specific restriction-modification system, R subunit [Companilactobacillus nodensis DSM 19682 = JCM 14932 = NBRC 107160]
MGREVNELEFEDKLINYLVNLGGTKQWDYLPDIKTTDDLWKNFKSIIEQHNQDRLDYPLSNAEFNQIKTIIRRLATPYLAGQFLYGMNGIAQVEIDRDDGKHVYLKIFDQDNIGAGDTIYQIVNQIERPAIIPGHKNRRFDTTLLINGLPIIQIEEKADGHDAKEALNQMHQYIEENQYSDIFSTLQILVAITPHDSRYMANSTGDSFNTDFAFRWQKADDNKPVFDWKEFANSMLSIPMSHQMATNYMILDGTPRHQMIKVMRPYQVYATQRVIRKLRQHMFGIDDQGAGYVWHTTGSGKTISSFKAAWLASRLPNVDKVVFLVDRVALTNQTVDEYKAYDPENTEDGNNGVVTDTANRWVLERKLNKKGNGIIVTSTQKMDSMVRDKNFKRIDKNIVFIVDEAHRSTSGDMLKRIKSGFRKSAWIGYTGTPVFETHPTTSEIFGDLIHAYTIRDAIADGNVLGFKVDFETTLSDSVLRDQYLPEHFKMRYPKMSEEDIETKIDNMADEDMDDTIKPSVYDENSKHVELVVNDIIKNWNKRSRHGEYNALFTTHVGGGKASTPMAMMYYNEFKKRNKKLDNPLKVGITFSQDTSNSDKQLKNNDNLRDVMNDYNKEFGTSFDDTQVKEYTAQVVSRLNRTIDDGKYFDIVIVVDQLLTGFNAPQMNTLYVDRTLQGAALIQAYSRTNRVYDMQTKPFGRIVNYRWPHHTEDLMKKALAVYANRDSANIQTEMLDPSDEIITKPYEEVKGDLKQVVDQLADYSDDFTRTPDITNPNKVEEMYSTLRKYNHLMAMIKQDDKYDDEHPEKLLNEVGIDIDTEEVLTTTLTNEIKNKISVIHNVDVSQIDLKMEHVKAIRVNYDYLEELIADLMNQYHDQDIDSANKTAKEIKTISDKVDDRKYAEQIIQFAADVLQGIVKYGEYPVKQKDIKDLVSCHNDMRQRNDIFDYKKMWGLADIDSSQEINKIIENHVKSADDLNINGILDEIVKEGTVVYRTDADEEEVRELSRIKYRTHLRRSFKKFADKMVDKY